MNYGKIARTLGNTALTLSFAVGPMATYALASEALQKKVPAEMREAGKIVLGTSADVGLPWSSTKPGTTDQYTGLDPDLAAAIAEKLGLKLEVSNIGFDALIPSLQAGRINFISSAMFDNVEREKKVDFVNQAIGGSAVLTTSKLSGTIKSNDDLCGNTAATLRGAVEIKNAEEISAKCVADGKEAIDIKVFPDIKSEIAAIKSDRVQVIFGDLGYLGLLATKQADQFAMVGEPFNTGLVGIAVPKDSPLGPLIAKAIDELIADGTYGKLLDQYGFPEAARVTKATINAAGAAK